MNLRDRMRNPNTMMRLGMASLLVANVARYFLHPIVGFGQGLIDGTVGLLFGVAIGCLLLSLRLRDRRCPGDGQSQGSQAALR